MDFLDIAHKLPIETYFYRNSIMNETDPNREGIERFDATTLLLINDDYPPENGKTIFGFVKLD